MLLLHAAGCYVFCLNFKTLLTGYHCLGVHRYFQLDKTLTLHLFLIKDSPFSVCFKPEAWESPLVSSLLFMNSLFLSLIDFAFLHPYSKYVPGVPTLFCYHLILDLYCHKFQFLPYHRLHLSNSLNLKYYHSISQLKPARDAHWLLKSKLLSKAWRLKLCNWPWYGLSSCCCENAPWPRQPIEGRVYLGVWCQRAGVCNGGGQCGHKR